ncbi:MAG: SHOCT domain-containing protein [Sulfuricurvum sp.]|nr:SHOCT domain-containing protein [Sulfuricurvum sp.]MDD5386895.1 SHOCT domain-containing protein [Sulfuricurvum sp.]
MENSMMMFGVLGLLFCISIFALWIWALVDIISSRFNDVAIKIVWFLLVFFIPFLGFILYVILGKSMKIPENTTNLNQKYDALERIKQLYDNGVLNETEFEAEKQKIMGQN